MLWRSIVLGRVKFARDQQLSTQNYHRVQITIPRQIVMSNNAFFMSFFDFYIYLNEMIKEEWQG
jgi:hypothetical protein